jgi:hypothetical protein
MRAIYMPFTHMSKASASALANFFGEVTLYRLGAFDPGEALRTYIAQGSIKPICPAGGDEEQLALVVKRYQAWAQLQPGLGTAGSELLKLQGEAVPFFDDTAISQIRSAIRRGTDAPGDVGQEDQPDPLFEARVFLRIAEEYDAQNEEIEADLDYHDAMQADLMRQLRGEEGEYAAGLPSTSPGQPLDPGGVMTAERVRSWIHLHLHTQDSRRHDHFITDSSWVMEHLIGDAEKLKIVPGFERLRPASPSDAAFQQELAQVIAMLANAEDPFAVGGQAAGKLGAGNTHGEGPRLSLYALAGVSPVTFFQHFLGASPQESVDPHGALSTVIALVER